jgi:hypothetical protein
LILDRESVNPPVPAARSADPSSRPAKAIEAQQSLYNMYLFMLSRLSVCSALISDKLEGAPLSDRKLSVYQDDELGGGEHPPGIQWWFDRVFFKVVINKPTRRGLPLESG